MTEAGGDGPRRLHWSSILSTLAQSARAAWGILAGGAYFAASGRWFLVVAVLGASFLFSLVGAFIRWRSFTYLLGSDDIRIDSGVINRKHRSVPYDRIQDVEISQGPVARLLGVARIKLETGGSAAGQEEGVLQAVALTEAESLRQLVRARRSGVTEAWMPNPDEGKEELPAVFAMGTKRLLLAGLFNFSLAVFAALAGASQTFGDVLNIDPFSRGFWRDMEGVIGPFAAVLLAHRVAAAIAGLLMIGVIGLATGVTRTVLRDYGFRVDRTEAGLRRRRGLLTKGDVTLQLRRVQAAVVGSGPVRAAFGWNDLKLQSLAQDESGKEDHVVAPLATAEETDALLAELKYPPVGDAGQWQPVSSAYVVAFLIATSPLYLVALGQAIAVPWIGLGFTAVVAGLQAMRWLAWKRTAFLHEGGRVMIRHGWWRRRTFVLPARNIQTIDLSESFISRRFGTASLTFGVAGGTGHTIPAIPRETARQLRSDLLSLAA